jgi:Family of unknown function (DUF6516)
VTTLADLLDYIVGNLQVTPLMQDVHVTQTTQFSETQFGLKVRAGIAGGGLLYVRIYQNGDHVDYSYQVVRDDRPLMRWDKKEHFHELATHPHHFHSPGGRTE